MVIMNSDKILLPDNTGNVSVVTVDDELGKGTHVLARGSTAGAARATSSPGVASSTRNSRKGVSRDRYKRRALGIAGLVALAESLQC